MNTMNRIIPTTTGGTYYLHVLTVDNAGNKKEIISSAVTIKSSIVGGEYNEGKGVNTPRYDENQMTPIKWNGSSWVKTAGNDPDWYDYTAKKWANAKTSDGSMWVILRISDSGVVSNGMSWISENRSLVEISSRSSKFTVMISDSMFFLSFHPVQERKKNMDIIEK